MILIARMTPALSYLIPLFLLFQWLGLNNTLIAADHHPSRHHRADRRLDHDRLLRDARRRSSRRPPLIDGATRWQVFRHVALPLARPA